MGNAGVLADRTQRGEAN